MKKKNKIPAQDLNEINKSTIDELTENEIFTFKAIFSDKLMNELDYEEKKKIVPHLIGNFVLEDDTNYHCPIAKVYKAEYGTLTPTLLCYMVKTVQNADLIARIRAGIKKKVTLLITDGVILHLHIVKG